jgi:hypothetical protein
VRDALVTEARVLALHLDDRGDCSAEGPFGPGVPRRLGVNSKRYVRATIARWKPMIVEGLARWRCSSAFADDSTFGSSSIPPPACLRTRCQGASIPARWRLTKKGLRVATSASALESRRSPHLQTKNLSAGNPGE